MSSRKRGQAGREGPRGRELKMAIIHVTIEIVPSNIDMSSRKLGQAGREGPRGRE